MYKKLVPLQLVLLLAVAGMGTGCAAFRAILDNPVVINQGPAVVRDSTAVFTQIALVKKGASIQEAELIKQHILDGENLLMTGTPPATALNALAEYLNTRIENAFVRSAIQQGIMLLANQIKLPRDGLLSTEALTWVKAVLDGAKAGCDAYIAGKAISASGAVTISAPDRINFYDQRAAVPNDGWINFGG